MHKLTAAACLIILIYAAYTWTTPPLFVGLYIMLLFDFVAGAVKDD